LKYPANSSTLLKAALFCGVTLCALNLADAQETKIGYISAQRIITEGLPYKEAKATLDQAFGKRASELREMESRLSGMQAKLEKDAPVMSEGDRLKAQRDLSEMAKEYQRKQREFQEDVTQRQNEERESVSTRVHKVIEQVAKEEKYDLVIQDAEYHSARIDITDKVLKVLNKQ
jgi:outer membrane protein